MIFRGFFVFHVGYGVFYGETFEKVSPHPFKAFTAFLLAYPLRESLSYRFLFSCSALGKSLYAVQTLLTFFLSHADGAIAPASVLVPPPKTLHKVSFGFSWETF